MSLNNICHYFDISQDFSYRVCKLCNVQIKNKTNGSTFNLLRHLKEQHSEESTSSSITSDPCQNSQIGKGLEPQRRNLYREPTLEFGFVKIETFSFQFSKSSINQWECFGEDFLSAPANHWSSAKMTSIQHLLCFALKDISEKSWSQLSGYSLLCAPGGRVELSSVHPCSFIQRIVEILWLWFFFQNASCQKC